MGSQVIVRIAAASLLAAVLASCAGGPWEKRSESGTDSGILSQRGAEIGSKRAKGTWKKDKRNRDIYVWHE